MQTSEIDQEQILDLGLKNIKRQAFQIHSAIEKNNLRQCLKEANLMLLELRNNDLSPKNYYHLYTVAFDEMQQVSNYFEEEIKRGRLVKDLYDSVQQAKYIIPRIYLLITAGAISMEVEPKTSREIIFDMFNMVKGIQNPIRGLFTRYYLLKMIKDKLPEDKEEKEPGSGNLDDTLNFILQNLEEMNRLWIRLSSSYIGPEKQAKEKERRELKILVGENITRLSSLNGLTLDIYQNIVLPKIITILIESKDELSQEYLMECIIQAFPDDYNIHCMSTILDTTTQLNPNVDVKSLLITLMDKLARFVGDDEKEESEILAAAERIFSLLKETIDRLISEGSGAASMDINKLIELLVAFMKFTIKCCPTKEKLETVNHILSTSESVLEKNNLKLNQDGIKLIGKLLTTPLESELSLFDLPQFPTLMIHLDFSSRSTLSLRIVESLINGTTKEKLDNIEKVEKLIGFITPLLQDSGDAVDSDPYQFDFEQNAICKLIFVISTNSPNALLQIYRKLSSVFENGGNKRKKYTLPALSNAIILLCSQFSATVDYKNGLTSENETKTQINQDFRTYLDISFVDSNETFYKFLLEAYKLLNDIITSIAQDTPEIGLKLYLDAASQVNQIQTDRDQFEEAAASFINAGMAIYQEGKYETDVKFNLLNQINGTLLSMTILSKEVLSQIITILQQSAQAMVKRGDQCNAMLSVSNLCYSLLGDHKKVIDCLNKAKRFADFAMTNPRNLNLFVLIMNKILYFIEIEEEEFIQPELVDDIIEIVQNHIQTIKTENNDHEDFLPQIEKYFEGTLDIIRKRREEGKKKIYSEVALKK